MGGEIIVESELGKGSCFAFQIQVSLVYATPKAESSDFKRALSIAPGQPNYRILVAEDVPANRLLLVKLLSSLGFETREAENGQDAIAIWQQWHPHLIFMDMRMPVMNGYEATRKIKQFYQNNRDFPINFPLTTAPAIIALTASAFSEQRQQTLAAGCDDFVSKPFRREVILETLAKYLGVQYSFEETNNGAGANYQTQERSDRVLDAKDLEIMPLEWIAKLYQAAAEGDDTVSMKLIHQIPSQQSFLIAGLTNLVETYQFEQLMELAKPTLVGNA